MGGGDRRTTDVGRGKGEISKWLVKIRKLVKVYSPPRSLRSAERTKMIKADLLRWQWHFRKNAHIFSHKDDVFLDLVS